MAAINAACIEGLNGRRNILGSEKREGEEGIEGTSRLSLTINHNFFFFFSRAAVQRLFACQLQQVIRSKKHGYLELLSHSFSFRVLLNRPVLDLSVITTAVILYPVKMAAPAMRSAMRPKEDSPAHVLRASRDTDVNCLDRVKKS